MTTESPRVTAYRQSPEGKAIRAERIRTGRCVVDEGWCVTHNAKADLGHDLDINGYTRPDGTARDE